MLNHRGVSTRKIAAAVGIAQGRLYDYMNGKSRVERLAIFEQIADAFHIPGHLLGLARRHWEPRDHAPRATSSVSLAPLIDSVEEDDVAAVDAFRHADRATGGGRLYSAVVTHLREHVAPRLVDLSGGQAFAAAAALTEMAGWMAHDSGRDRVAQAHFARALPLARASGDTALTANIAASSSHLALQAGDSAAAVHWAQTGLDAASEGPRVPTLIARLHAMQARALAAAGQHSAAERALDQARLTLRDAPVKVAHPWVSPFDAAALASESAEALRDMGRLREAVEYARQAVDLREAGRARSLALSRIALAGLHVQCGDLDAALLVGEELLTATAPTLGSVRVMQQLQSLGAQFEPNRSHPPVREFLMRLTAERRARMLLLADILTPQGGHPV
ncbi:helix-turn-helix domain-containing protein [Streptomyces yaanensis]|uniref:Helix-turn-helix domain-containing protein n=1 Tax=Streptomyces yaanensis TaxID=1142239 RepID=A0ABV7SM57_9ACTN|nr:helix-turn-helix transcriptional regulator [Streptomyces sp. CGMCC 4.7035]WNC02080.1 helix-turn-helix transcriptional regulator [Streptomyces sp. CGMCC 4.7035]